MRGGSNSEADPEDENADIITAWIAGGEPEKRTECPEIVADEMDALALFLALDTQWNWHPMAGVRTGFNYAVIPATAAGCGIELTPSLFADIRQMEAAALNELGRKA